MFFIYDVSETIMDLEASVSSSSSFPSSFLAANVPHFTKKIRSTVFPISVPFLLSLLLRTTLLLAPGSHLLSLTCYLPYLKNCFVNQSSPNPTTHRLLQCLPCFSVPLPRIVSVSLPDALHSGFPLPPYLWDCYYQVSNDSRFAKSSFLVFVLLNFSSNR